MKLDNIIDEIEADISTRKEQLCIIYMAIGSATNAPPNKKIEEQNYHQYPLCLQNMKDDQRAKIFHILIDPYLEDPPYIVTDTDKLMPCVKKNTAFYNEQHTVYPLKQSISTLDKTSPHTNIMNDLERINNITIIHNNVLFVYNDFTGRPIEPLARYFDPYIIHHLNRIFYGLGNRHNYGCMIDLTDLSKTGMVYTFENNQINVFNPYYYFYNNIDINPDKYPIKHIETIHTSIEMVIKSVANHFENNIFPDLRTLYCLMNDKLELNDDIRQYIFNETSLLTDSTNLEEFKTHFENKNYKYCFDKYIELVSNKLDILIYLKKLELNSIELLQIITSDKKEYTWIDMLNYIIV